MGAAPNAGLRVVVRDAKGNEHLRSIDELLCSERAAAEDHADYDKRVLAAIRQGIATRGALLEIIGGQREDIRASLARHLEAGHIAKDGGTYTVAKPTTRASKPKSRAKSKAKPEAKSEPKAKPKEEAEPPKVQAKAKASNTPKPKKPKEPRPAKTAKEPADTPEKRRAEYDAATLRAVEGGALTSSAVREQIGGSPFQSVSALTRLVEAGKLVLVEEGPPARYKPATAVPAKSRAARQKLPKLTWKSTSTRGRKGYTAAWDVGAFKMLVTQSGSFALFYQKDGTDKYEEYGCGPSREVKKQARMIAAAGVPSAEQWRAQGGKPLGDCPVVRRVTKSKSATLTWTDTIQDGRQVCVAPTTDGEFRMETTEGGSFALIFVREGDSTGESLGTGKKATLLKRALEIVDEEAKETAASDDDGGGDGASDDDIDDTDEAGDDDIEEADEADDVTDDETGDDADDEVAEEAPQAPQAKPDNAGQAANDAQMMAGLMKVLENL